VYQDKILDVGCGYRPRGHVNLDQGDLEVIPNYVKGDATNLPFDDKSFSTVYSSGLSLWRSDIHTYDELSIAWKEARRVAIDQVIFEYNHYIGSQSWPTRYPLDALKVLHKEISPEISLSYSKRGKFAKLVILIEKLIGIKLTIWIVNKMIRKTYFAEFKLFLSDKRGLPETYDLNTLKEIK
jgi:ubiquinone/menaquinone biosynthesis C-methylase UbiE